jgi:hypothetical protein
MSHPARAGYVEGLVSALFTLVRWDESSTKVDESQTSRIGGWGRIAIVIGVVLSIAWTGAMIVRGNEQMRFQKLAIADDAKRSEKGKRRQASSKRIVSALGLAPTLS